MPTAGRSASRRNGSSGSRRLRQRNMMLDFGPKTMFALASVLLAVLPGTAAAQTLPVIAIPPVPTPSNVETDAGKTGVIGIQVADQIESDLRSSGDFMVIPR